MTTGPARAGRRGSVAALLGGLALAAGVVTAPPAQADAVRDDQWMLDAVDAPQAWQTTRGAGSVVGIVDDGIAGDVPDLAGNVRRVHDRLVPNARGGERWHGTAMTSLVVGHGHGPGNGSGVIGIAPGAQAVGVDIPLGRRSRGGDVAKAIDWLVDQGVGVINLSLGTKRKVTPYQAQQEVAAVARAVEKDVVVVASAGNEAQQGNQASFPAAAPGAVGVAAVDRYHRRADFSQHRPYVDVAAPGVDMVVVGDDGQYYTSWGTSQASAVVTGVVALVRSEYPGIPARWIPSILRDSTTHAPDGGYDQYVGWGTVNAAKALEVAEKRAVQLREKGGPGAVPGGSVPDDGPAMVSAGGAVEGWTAGAPGEPLPPDPRRQGLPWLAGGLAGAVAAAVLLGTLLRRRRW